MNHRRCTTHHICDCHKFKLDVAELALEKIGDIVRNSSPSLDALYNDPIYNIVIKAIAMMANPGKYSSAEEVLKIKDIEEY